VKWAIDVLFDEAATDTARNSTYLSNVRVKMKSILGERNWCWLITRLDGCYCQSDAWGKGLMKEPHSFHHDGFDNLFRDKRSQGEKSIKTYRTNSVTNDQSEGVCFRKSYKTFNIIARKYFKIVANVSRNCISYSSIKRPVIWIPHLKLLTAFFSYKLGFFSAKEGLLEDSQYLQM